MAVTGALRSMGAGRLSLSAEEQASGSSDKVPLATGGSTDARLVCLGGKTPGAPLGAAEGRLTALCVMRASE